MASTAELARAYDQYVSALWRGDAAAAPFGAWLRTHWRDGPVPQPAAPPIAISPCGGGGRGICWYETETTIFGCIPGADGYYAVPLNAVLPPADVLLSARYRDESLAVAPASPDRRELSESVVAGDRPTRPR